MIRTAVLMATYNGENLIEEQLDSIRSQTLKPTYVIMRDDGSSDQTIEVVQAYIQKYQLDGWKVVQNEQNLGWRLNFRQLLLDVRDLDIDYVFFSDQDDVWYQDKNEKQVSIMEENRKLDLLSGDVTIQKMSEDATVPSNFQFQSQEEISYYPKDFTYHNYRQGWTFCLRKSFVDGVMSHYSDGLILSHDNLMTGISGVLGTGANLNKPVGIHKRHAGNASGNLLNVHSSYERHVSELNLVLSYYKILVPILKEKGSSDIEEAENYLAFYEERMKNADNRNFFRTIRQIVTQGKYYDSFSNRIRDLVFLLKKSN